MPFTPFHFGPAIAIKAATRGYFSLTIFCYSQVIMDLEPGYFLMRHEYPVHRWFHTYFGATVVALFCALTGRPICQWLLRLWKRLPAAPLNEVFADSQRIGWGTTVMTALIGTWSHVFLDSLMHRDIQPMRPFTNENAMLGFIDLGLLHLICLVCGVAGFLIWVQVKARRVKRSDQANEP
jgi:Domain of unknown function (DUF4184)